MSKSLHLILIFSSLAFASWIGWMIAKPSSDANQSESSSASVKLVAQASDASKLIYGDPVERLRSGRSKAEREEIMGAFMALGHERNSAMLIDALRDESVELRVHAVEYAASLTPAQSALVLTEAVLNENKDVRDMGWSLLAPHPLENKAPVIFAAIDHGSDASLEEMFSEMGRTPERALFEAMLLASGRTKDARKNRVLKEMQEWLKPGGGSVPNFQNVDQLAAWWATNKQRYDQFMLRVDL
ncbi:MAG: hypothetical protein ABL974_08765 [Prosthecobacter sp.]